MNHPTALAPDPIQVAFVRPARAWLAKMAARLRRPDLPLVVFFVGYPLWWILGLSQIACIVAAIPMAVQLLRRRVIRMPKGYGLWLSFLVWVVLSSVVLEPRLERYLAFGYRLLLYLSATTFFLWVYNMPSKFLPLERIVRLLLTFWGVALVGGYLGVLIGDVELSSPFEPLLPGPLGSSEFVVSLLTPRIAQEMTFLGFAFNRPSAPFLYTNQWGANTALLTPVALAAWAGMRGWKGRLVMPLALLALVVPAVISVNRGLWLSLTAAGIYVTVRRAGAGQRKNALRILGAFAFVVSAVMVSPLYGFVQGRAESDHANGSRSELYAIVIDSVSDSPLLGFGAPRSDPDRPNLPAVGTHGQFWTVLYSQGIPGAILYVSALFMLAYRTARGLTPERLWLHVTVGMLLVQMMFYNVLPMPLHLAMICAAGLLRPEREQPETEVVVVDEPDEHRLQTQGTAVWV